MTTRPGAPGSIAACALVLGLATLGAGRAAAHGTASLVIEVRESRAGDLAVAVRGGAALRLELDGVCSARGAERGTAHLACSASLAGRTLHVAGATATDPVLIVYHAPDGARHVLVSDDRGAVTFPAHEPARLTSWIATGTRHVLSGLDHVLFVVCLTLLEPRARRLLGLVTAFTLAHSVSLAASALGLVHLPGPPVELCIAVSVLLLANELVRGGAVVPRPLGRLAIATFAFGLLHGLGFASALGALGATSGEKLRALFGFNLGVELGQLAVVAAVWLVARGLRAAAPAVGARWLARGAGWTAGGLAALWVGQRAVDVWR